MLFEYNKAIIIYFCWIIEVCMFLRLLLAVFTLVHGVSFSMIVHYKDKEAQKRVENSVRGYIAKQEIIEERKKWQSVPQEEQGKYKLARLYKKQDNPKFVARYLKNQNVPIVLVDILPSKELIAIDPYTEWFYKNFDKQIFAKDLEIMERELLMFKDIQQAHPLYRGAVGVPLYSSVLFGKNEDVAYELEQIDKFVRGADAKVHRLQKSALFCAITYPSVKNNALKMLLQREKKLSAAWMNSQDRCDSGYALLRTAAQNKEAFELIAHTDPYHSNRILYPYYSGLTHLDRMKKKVNNGKFDQEHIDIFVREGGMSATEVEGMNQVDRILRGKFTDEELLIKNVWDKIIRDSNSNNSNKYLESQMLLRDIQEREEVRRMNQRVMMTAGLMHAMFGDGDID